MRLELRTIGPAAGTTLLCSLLLLALIPTSRTLAQETVVVSVGEGYAFETYYDLDDGISGSQPLDAWDIGFQMTGFSSAIITNGGTGIQLYPVPGADPETFGTAIDTNGMAGSWNGWYNSASTWNQGAFNLGSDFETGNFGWGEYNMVTHVVSGTTLYVIVLPDGSAKQIVIDGLSSGTYSFRYADLDGGNVTEASVSKSDFAGKQFGYYSIRDGKTVDQEPQIQNWDLVFGKYIAWVGPEANIPYVVTGVRSNPEVLTAAVTTENPLSEPAPQAGAFTTDITTIGHDWKEFTGAWSIRADVAYFVQSRVGDIYRIVFTDFGGSSSGDITFQQQNLGVLSVRDNEQVVARFGIYPNTLRSGDRATVVLSAESKLADAEIAIVDAAGRTVQVLEVPDHTGLQQIPLETDLAPGWYSVALTLNGTLHHQSFIVH